MNRAFSPWLALLLLPLGLVVGWLVGQIPTPRSPAPTQQVASSVAPPVAPAPPRSTAGPVSVDMQVTRQAPEPAAETVTPTFSPWTTYQSAMDESRRTGKPVMIDFSAEWCGPCRRLKQEVFDDPELGRKVQTTVIPVSIVDRSREDGSNPPDIDELQRRFGVDAFPTVVVISARNGHTARTQGFGDPDQMTTWITQSANAVR